MMSLTILSVKGLFNTTIIPPIDRSIDTTPISTANISIVTNCCHVWNPWLKHCPITAIIVAAIPIKSIATTNVLASWISLSDIVIEFKDVFEVLSKNPSLLFIFLKNQKFAII